MISTRVGKPFGLWLVLTACQIADPDTAPSAHDEAKVPVLVPSVRESTTAATEAGPEWPNFKAGPMDINSETPLPACEPTPACWLEEIGRLDRDFGDRGALVVDERGVTLVGLGRPLTEEHLDSDFFAHGFMDQARRTWVRFGVGAPILAKLPLVSEANTIVGLCYNGDHISTGGGYGTAFLRCHVFDLKRRRQLLEIDDDDASGELIALRGAVADIDLFFYRVPRWCQPPPGDDPYVGRPRMGPAYAVRARLDLATTPPRLLARPVLSEYNEQSGDTPLGPCLNNPPGG